MTQLYLLEHRFLPLRKSCGFTARKFWVRATIIPARIVISVMSNRTIKNHELSKIIQDAIKGSHVESILFLFFL